MTRIQRMFNKAVRAIRKQGVACTDPSTGECRYRGQNGLKCIVGHLFPDSLYNPRMENASIYALINDFPEIKRYFQNRYSVTENTVRLLASMQTAHDSYLRPMGVEAFEEKIVEIAHRYNLVVPPVS